MKRIILCLVVSFYSCSFLISKKDKIIYSNNFKIYHYSKTDLPSNSVCLDIKENVFNIFFEYRDNLKDFDNECSLYIDVKSKKKINNSFRYTAYIDFDNFVKELKNRYGIINDVLFLNVNADKEIVKFFMDMNKKNELVFFQDYPEDLIDGSIKIDSNVSKIETSAGEIYSVNLESLILKGNKTVEKIVTTGYGPKEYAYSSAVNELILKVKQIKDNIKPDYAMIEFSNIKSSSDFSKIYNFLSKKFARFKVLEIKKNYIVVKVPLKKSLEEISSQMLSTIDGSAVELIDNQNKKVFITLNYSDVGIW